MVNIETYRNGIMGMLRFILTIALSGIVSINVAVAENADNFELIKSYVSNALDKYQDGDRAAARVLINKALSLSSQNGDYPGVYIQSGFLYMKDGDCDSALKEIKISLSQLEYLKNLADHGKIAPEKEFGEKVWAGLKEYYYLGTYISAYCNYRVGDSGESIKSYLVIEKERRDKFELFDMTKLAHDYQLTGDNDNAIKYYTMSLKQAKDDIEINPFLYEKLRGTVETVQYNIAIAHYQQNNKKSAIESVKSLLASVNDPKRWIETMEKDKDYSLLLRDKEIIKIIDGYKTKARK